MSQTIGEFIANVIKTLHKNGYPEKKVSLPFEQMYSVASEKGFSFNKVLDFLKEKEGIDHEKTTDKIIFFPAVVVEEPAEPSGMNQMFSEALKGFDPSKLAGKNFTGMMAEAAKMMKNMTPEQLAEIQNMVKNLTPEERQELMNKTKNM